MSKGHGHRGSPWLLLMTCAAALFAAGGLWSCGSTDLDAETQLVASPVSEMIATHDEALIPVAQYRGRGDVDKPGTPCRVGTPAKWSYSKEEFDAYGDGPDDSDDPIRVRETGFRPADEDDPTEVRETGFLGRPDLRLVGMDGDVGEVSWRPILGADAYEIFGTRFAAEGIAVETFTEDLSGTRARIPTLGLYTRVRVVAVARDGVDRSKPSNEVEIFPQDRD
jgi:hypothetical protein